MTTDAATATLPAQSDQPKPKIALRSWITLALCAGLLILFASLSYSAARTKNATYDEPLHAVSGYAIRNFSDYRIDPEDPALFTWLSALPHRKGALKFDLADPMLAIGKKTVKNEAKEDVQVVYSPLTDVHDNQWIIAVKTLYRTPGNDADAYLNRSRFLFMLIGVATGALVCWWGWDLAGKVGAFAATAAYALDPNFIGHSSLVKNDVPLALVTVGLMFALWRFGRRGTWWNFAAIVIALAAAMNVKFSGPIFFIIAFLTLLLRAVMPQPWKIARWEIKPYYTLFVPFVVCLVAGLFSIISIWACYGFRYAPTSDASLHFDFNAIVDRGKTNIWRLENENRDFTKLTVEQMKREIEQVPTPKMASITRSMMDQKLLPEAWLNGFFYTYATTIMRGSFLNGKYSLHGWWYFFPLAVLYKTPTAIIATGLLALVAWIVISIRSRAIFGHSDVAGGPIWSVHSGVWSAICLLMAVVIYGGMAMTSNFNLGIRHVLPLLPFAHLAAGLVVARMLWRWGKLGALLAGGLGMGLAIESCTAWPNYISFFNQISGGARKAVYRLSDSNLDWGQDLHLLADWQKQHPEKTIYLSYFGMADANYYNIRHVDLMGGYDLATQVLQGPDPRVPGIIAISATRLQGTYNTPEFRKNYEPLWHCEPREILGGTIYLYDWPLRQPTTQQ